jgi:hypothetical protein
MGEPRLRLNLQYRTGIFGLMDINKKVAAAKTQQTKNLI